MIPLSRVDSDDRPAGLKLARNNTGYAYSSTTNTTATHTENAAGGSLFDDDLQWLDQRSRASMESSSRRIESGRFQHPSVPARSPFRIRDSQTSVASRAPSTTVTKPFQSTKWSPTFESEEPRNVIDNRASLSVEVARMWKRQPAVGASNDQDKGRKDDKSKEEGMDGLLGQLLVSQALVDAELYNTLTFEQLSELKQQRNELKERIASLEMRWAVDKQVQDVSRSLVQLDREHKNDTPSSRAASELIELLNEEAVIRQKILEHTAGALKLGFESYKEDEHQQQKLEQQQKPVENSGRLREAEQEIESLKAQMKQMTAANSRETNQEIESLKAQIKQMTTANAHETDREVERLKAQIQQMAATNSRETNQEVDRLNARIKQMTAAMVSFGERQDLHEISDRSDEQQWISAVESQFSNYKLKMRRLERELESNEEKLRLESVTAKKIETQLRIMQDKRDAAETKYRDMEKKYLDRELNIDSYNNTSATTRELENELSKVKYELEMAQDQVAGLQASLAEMEVRCTRAESEAAASASREIAADARLEQYQAEASALRAEKQRWERALKRESVLQMMEGGSDSFKAKYEQQLEEMRQEYEAELQEQRALLAKTTRAQQHVEADRDKMSSVCKDLEDLIRDKSRTIDARDIRINQIEDELKQLRQQGRSMLNNEELSKAQKAFTEREEAWLAQSASMETNFEGIMKEFERLTMSAMEFETDRMKYEQRIEQHSRDIERLEAELTEEKINKLGYDAKEGPTTASLRKEFRQLVNDMKSKQQKMLDRELEERKRLEGRLKDMKHELESKRYERVNQSVQTYFVA